MANPSDWAQLYSHTFAKQEDHHHPFIMSDQISSTTTGIAANSLSSTGNHHMAGTNNTMMGSSAIRENFHLSYTPDGRVSKPSRKRTRVSAKKDHTTILNTDISNFRAMVQQFTGAPQSAFLSTSSVPRVNLSGNYNNNSSGMSYEYNQQTGHQLHPYEKQQQQLMIQLLNNKNRNDHGFDIGGLSNVNKLHVSCAAKMKKSDGFMIADGNSSRCSTTTTSSSYEMFPAPRVSSFDLENNSRTNNGFVSF